MSFSKFFTGRVGILGSSSDYNGNDSSVPIILDPANGTIKGNIATDPTDFNQPNVSANFQALNLVDANLAVNSTADRLVVQLPNSNDVIKVGYDGRIERVNTSTSQANWVVGLPTANNGGVECRFNTNTENLQLYVPDNGGATALYNSSNQGYVWYLGTGGDATFQSVVSRGNIFGNANMTINGNLTVQGVINGAVQSEAVSIFASGNVSIPNDANNYEILVNANNVGVGSGDLTITLPIDPTHQMEVNVSVVDLGVANDIAVGTGSPQIQFLANGLRSFCSLKARGISKTTFKYVSWGINGDWWTVSPF
jgi:hypothetical protein